MSQITSPTHFLSELAEGHSGPAIPSGKRAYFQQRLRNRIFNFLLNKFVQEQANGLTQKILANRIGKSPEVVNRWLGAPSNMTVDSISDLLLGIAGEELELEASSPLRQIASNYSHINDLSKIDEKAKTISPEHDRLGSVKSRNLDFDGQNQESKSSAANLEVYGQQGQ